jgi:hypothetical protein
LRQNAGDVFPDDPPWLKCLRQSDELQREATARVGKSLAESSDGEGLTGGSTDEEVDASRSNRVIWFGETSKVSVVRDMRVSLLKDGSGERFDLAERSWLPPERVPRDGRGFNA